ncbi:MAG TPA: glycosyltransferase family 4 protein [Candidatus Paceibacterota bacterium]|nr:glycosyltransferase family 4 protein [Candidatus Paceibacterota bacterium]
MRIAMVAPLVESVPPKYYGGTERVMDWLIKALLQMGHRITLFASGDSVTGAELHACVPKNLREMWKEIPDDQKPEDYVAWQKRYTKKMLDDVYLLAMNGEFDVVHLNVDDPYAFELFSDTNLPCAVVMTMHGRQDYKWLHAAYRKHPLPLVSISNNQRELMVPNANWAGTVYHGLPEDLYQVENAEQGEYLLFIGRTSPEKGLKQAIEIAVKANMELKIVAKIDPSEEDYFWKEIQPLIFENHSLVKFCGEKGDAEKQELLSGARALLFPICWPEPFGLVMIEAMATGRPVIAYRHGSVPEVLQHGETGFIIKDDAEAAALSVEMAKHLKPQNIRRIFKDRFSNVRMAEGYVEIYKKLISENQVARKPKAFTKLAG